MRQYRKVQMGKDFDAVQISQRYHRLEYKTYSDKSVQMTGSDVESEFAPPFTFQLIRIELTHYDATNALSVTELEAHLDRKAGSVLDVPLATTSYWTKKQLNSSKMIIDFTGEEMVFEAGTHTLTLNGTSTDKVTVIIYIKELQ